MTLIARLALPAAIAASVYLTITPALATVARALALA